MDQVREGRGRKSLIPQERIDEIVDLMLPAALSAHGSASLGVHGSACR
jgi:hypothetical protein